MDDEYAKPRDVDSDLTEITSRLGEPDSTHRTNPGSVAWRFALGVFIVVAASTLHYLMWSGEIPWPRGLRLWAVLLAGMFIGPGVGLYLITFAIRGRKLWVLVYPTGLFVWHRGRVTGCPWDEIQVVQFNGLPDKAALNRPIGNDGFPESVWFDLTRSGRRVFGTTITLTRGDLEEATLTSTLTDFAELGQRVQQETYRRLFPKYWRDFQEGLITFGSVTCDLHAITVGKKSLRWSRVQSVERVADKLEIKQKEKKKAWAKVDLNAIVNLHVLLGIASAVCGGDPPV